MRGLLRVALACCLLSACDSECPDEFESQCEGNVLVRCDLGYEEVLGIPNTLERTDCGQRFCVKTSTDAFCAASPDRATACMGHDHKSVCDDTRVLVCAYDSFVAGIQRCEQMCIDGRCEPR